ncbi:MAG TPA: DUF4465 domain-containing protein [Bacteroidales bacterium]|nr:DUF4465 domain-containing protein [Bacteroidales bacterium]
MVKIYPLLLSSLMTACFSVSGIMAQNTADFENLNLDAESYYDGSSEHSGTEYATEHFPYTSGGITFPLNYTDWGGMGSFGGVAYSNLTDTTTASYTNYSAYATTPGGAEGSATYGIFYPSYGLSDSLVFPEPAELSGMYVTNHAWTYHYITGSDGSGEGTYTSGDSLVLSIHAYQEGGMLVDSVNYYLADFTDDNQQVVNSWTWLDLSGMSDVNYIKLSLTSSDDMTPLYACIDELTYEITTDIQQEAEPGTTVYPNPFNESIHINAISKGHYALLDASGRKIKNGKTQRGLTHISTAEIPHGIYYLQLTSGKRTHVQKIIK